MTDRGRPHRSSPPASAMPSPSRSCCVQALTHRSAADPRRAQLDSNERLEFLGDRVLALLIAEWLAERFPEEREGDLGKRLGVLVARDTLARVAENARPRRRAPRPAIRGQGRPARARPMCWPMRSRRCSARSIMDGGLPAAAALVRREWEAHWAPTRGRPCRPRAGCRNTPWAAAWACPNTGLVSTTGPSHQPIFVVAVAAAGREAEGLGEFQARRGTTGRRSLAGRIRPKMNGITIERRHRNRPGPRHAAAALRPGRRGRRPQCRQVHPGECPRRLQGHHRLAQAADHALPHPRGGDARRRPAHPGRYPRHLRPAPPAGPRHGRRRLGRGAGRRPHPADRRCPRRADRCRPRHHRPAGEVAQADLAGAEQGRPDRPDPAAAAGPGAERPGAGGGDLHDLRREEARPGQGAGPAGRRHAARPLPVPRGRALRPAQPHAGRRDRPRADPAPDARGSAAPRDGRDRELDRRRRTAASGSTAPSTSAARPRRPS